MTIVFYYAPLSSASPVASALKELDVPHERVTFDLARDDHKKPEFRAINPNCKVPTLVVDGTPMFEALAIMQWLGDRFGVEKRLWPAADDPARLEAQSWCTWSYVTYGAVLTRLVYAKSERVGAKLQNAAHAELALQQLDELLGLLDERLSKQPYLLGEAYSLADLIVASVIGYSAFNGAPVERHPRVRAWLESFQARESYRSAMSDAA